MKKAIAILAALVLMLASVSGLAEETEVPTFTGGVQFNMDMDQVMQIINRPNYEIESERTRGTVEFYELEYEDFPAAEGCTADVTYLFVGNSLIAIRFDMADGVGYEQAKVLFTAEYGDAVPFDAALIGNGRYAIDDDGDLKDCREMIVAEGFVVVLEQDHDGDVDVTILDTTAAYINQ